jgi:hypothetical protein
MASKTNSPKIKFSHKWIPEERENEVVKTE